MTADAFVAAAGGNGDEPATPDVYEQRAFGFWLYLMSDAIIFSLLFATYAVMARNNVGGPTGNMTVKQEATSISTKPLPVGTAEHTIRFAPNRSQPMAAPTMSAMESMAPTS